ncbi:MAG: exodeoxyribonuclease alpha subunit [Solirubrobacteraceae bacterium]|jgi:exodeoxyribonuclease V alpha subunit|nr:exodeoxyribonuclease alpha subunit [Solirubrobacteraceae bacterium]
MQDTDRTELALEVAAVRWKLPDGDFAVLVGLTDEGEEVTVTGALADVQAGEVIDVRGAFRKHAKHGWQFAAEGVRVREPVGEDALLAYLGAVKHVGERSARWLLDAHGPAVLAVIDADPHGRLLEAPGIGKARIGAATESWREQGGLRALRLFLDGHGVPAAVAARVYRAFGAGSVELLQADPYALTQLDGIGFATADALAQALGVPPDHPGRLDAGVMHALALAEDDGHCHLPRGELEERARRLLGTDASDRIDGLAAAGRLEIDDSARVADAALAAIERRLAARARALARDEPVLKLRDETRATTGGFVPTDDQWAAVTRALRSRLSILTGGPGVGKTASMRALVDLMRANKRAVRLCAPTGKAARRLAELTGAEATTIHRLLEWNPSPPTPGFGRDAGNPVDGCDMLIVDEASMLSLRLAEPLLDAVGPRTHVLLVGDVDQLAPVGPGRVLDDLIASEAIPVTRLTQIFRQAARSLIVRAAHAINHGEAPPTVPSEDGLRDFFLIERAGAASVFDEVVSLATERLPRHYELDPAADIQVLAPMYKGPVGIDALNAELRGRLNPDGRAIPGTPFRLQDKVIQTKNSHEFAVMNGETGVLVHHDDDRDRVLLATDDGRRVSLPVKELATFKLGFASSVHKAQGSQWRAVVVVLARAHHLMLTRNLIYTGITRASELLVLVAEPGTVITAARRIEARARHTRLAELVGG